MTSQNQKARVGRPSKYKPEFAAQAAKLCALGATDAQLADFFGVAIEDLAMWAYESREFFDAITPSPEQVAAYHAKFAKARARRKAARERRTTPSHRVLNAFRARFWSALKGKSSARVFRDFGYSLEELMSHLELRFEPGMTWENYGAWHIDHIKPCALFDHADPEQVKACWSLSNLQPLWAADNVKKGSRYASA